MRWISSGLVAFQPAAEWHASHERERRPRWKSSWQLAHARFVVRVASWQLTHEAVACCPVSGKPVVAWSNFAAPSPDAPRCRHAAVVWQVLQGMASVKDFFPEAGAEAEAEAGRCAIWPGPRAETRLKAVRARHLVAVLLAAASVALVGAAGPPPASGARATRVHVKKSERKMTLYAGDEVLATYAVAVGRGGAGHKMREGDNVTPVGHYRILKHEPSHLRIFLRIDYPNAEDRARFEEAKKRGELPKSATIGGEIGIHGEPPEAKPFKKADYLSHGCVVLEDAEIDQVARVVPDGTPVDIED
jgi:hypothetical protein